jgi:hypothetical protein
MGKTGLYFNSNLIAISKYEIVPHEIPQEKKKSRDIGNPEENCVSSNSWKFCKFESTKNLKSCIVQIKLLFFF